MNKFALIASMVLVCGVTCAEVYKWTDSSGSVHFSDTPHTGAEQVQLPKSQTYSAPAPNNPVSSPDSEVKDPKDTKTGEDYYTRAAIVQPLPEATIRNNQGLVVIDAQVEPMLQKNDNVQLIFDGTPLDKPKHVLNFQLTGIDRGSHTLAIQIVTSDDTVVKTSDSITFHMQRPRVGMVAPGAH